tara:strand:+ start:62 stop:313 length:252 start_codon:yes stop_codon:yes gene_type:complete
MEREIYLEDENGGKYLLKYLDEARVIVHTVTEYERPPGSELTEDLIRLSMPAKVRLNEIYKWPFTEALKNKILSWHADYPNAE